MREPVATFTSGTIKRLDLEPGETDVWIWCTEHAGLGVRLRRGKNGVSKTWYCSYRVHGRDRRDRIGDSRDFSVGDAIDCARQIRLAAGLGADPREARVAAATQAAKAASCPTFADYVEKYLNRRETGDEALRPATHRARERYLTKAYFEPFKKLRLDQIDKAMIAGRLNFLEDTGFTKPSRFVAQCGRTALHDLFKLAVGEGLIETNPVRGTRQPAAPRRQAPRERTLEPAELVALWNATGGDDDYSKIVRLLMLLGCRRQEVGGARSCEFGAGVWTLPPARTKTAKPLVLPLPPGALAIISSIERREGRDHLFGDSSVDGFSDWGRAKRLLDARLPLKPWRLHDLRRTLVTGLYDLGVEPHVVRALVNHSQGADIHTKHYNFATYLAAKGAALQKWADHIRRLVGANVVALPQSQHAA